MDITQHPAIGSALTAAQANSLPVRSRVTRNTWPPGVFWERTSHGWIDERGLATGDLALYDYILLRVGPSPTFIVGQVVTAAECNELPDGAVVIEVSNLGCTRIKRDGQWYYQISGYLASFDEGLMVGHYEYTIVSLPSTAPACPHAVGTLDWARWMAEREGACVQARGTYPLRWNEASKGWEFNCNGWDFLGDSCCITCEAWRNVTWSIVPDPSLPAETSVRGENETPLESAYLDTIADLRKQLERAKSQAARRFDILDALLDVLRVQKGESQIDAARRLTAERDRLRAEMDRLCRVNETQASKYKQVTEAFECVCTERDNLHAEKADLLHIGQNTICNLRKERDAALALAEKAEMEYGILEEAVAQRDAEYADLLASANTMKAQVSELMMENATLSEVRKERDTLRAQLAAARVVVPEDVWEAVDWTIAYCDKESCEGRMAHFILSFTAAHSLDPTKKVESQHPEGSREWAEDAMRQGFAVVWKDSPAHWRNFRYFSSCSDNGRKWDGMASDGWHLYVLEPAPALTLESLDARLKALETRVNGCGE